MKLYVYGASDDLIEVAGDLSDEFNGDVGVLTFSDGTELHVEYGNAGATWTIGPKALGKFTITKHPAVSEDDGPRRVGGEFDGMSTYSEIVVLEALEGEFDGPITASWRQL